MAIYTLNNFTPKIHPSSFVHPQSSIIGDVWIEKNCYIGPFASIRADFNRIVIQEGSNIQDSCTIHGYPHHNCIIGKRSHIGHNAIIHSATLQENTLIGMHSTILDEAIIGKNAVVGAHSLVPAKFHVPKNTLVSGSPCKIIKELPEAHIKRKLSATNMYIGVSSLYQKSFIEAPLEATHHGYYSPTEKDEFMYNDTNLSIFTTK